MDTRRKNSFLNCGSFQIESSSFLRFSDSFFLLFLDIGSGFIFRLSGISKKMGVKRLSRYFTLSRTDPKDVDYDNLKKGGEKINAFVVHKTIKERNRRILKAVIVLRGVPAVKSGSGLHVHFPNFLISSPGSFEFDVFCDGHPYDSVRKRLFDESFLVSQFLTGERCD